MATKKESKQLFIVQFELKPEKWQKDIIDKRFEIARQIYNSAVSISRKNYNKMIRDNRYSALMKKGSKSWDKDDKKLLKEIRIEYGFSDFGMSKILSNARNNYNTRCVDSRSISYMKNHLWAAWQKVLFADGDRVHYRKYNEVNSLESDSIKFENGTIQWFNYKTPRYKKNPKKKTNTKPFIVPVDLNLKNEYNALALQNEVSSCVVCRKWIRGKFKYYVQVRFKGVPPRTHDKKTGMFKHNIGVGRVGLDIGTQTIGIVSDTSVELLELADKVKNIENQKRLLLRKLDRSRRATNPNNYNADGTIKKQGNKKVTWVKSKHYIKLQSELKDIQGKQARIRKMQHEILANHIVSLGNQVFVETMSFKGLQAKAKKTTTNSKGKINRKKRYGKSIGNKAPSMLLTLIDRKLGYHGYQLNKIDTWSAKASQYNHFTDSYTKKSLNQRWNIFDNGDVIQRDLYSAFLIMNISDDLTSIDNKSCINKYNWFKVLHDIEINRLKSESNKTMIGSMGVKKVPTNF